MSDGRISVYFGNKAASPDIYLELKLDPDLYNSDTRTLVGATDDKGAVPSVPINIRYAVASGLVQKKKFKVFRGANALKQTRTVEVLVRKDLVDTIDAAATTSTKTLKLGRGATPESWTIADVV